MARQDGSKLGLQAQGWYDDIATRRCSPHFDERPDPNDVSLLVIHNISLPAGVFAEPYVDQLFMGALDTQCPEPLHELIGVRVSLIFLSSVVATSYNTLRLIQELSILNVSHFDGRELATIFRLGLS